MNTARWQQVKTILNEALDRPTGTRAAFLEQTCGDDPALRTEVRSLLDACDDTDDTFFEAGAVPEDAKAKSAAQISTSGDGASGDAAKVRPLAEGTRVGAYCLAEVLGRGGMGTVYRAVRADGAFEQEVAVKLLRPELATPEGLRRLRAERQILASLHHPGIAHILDGGVLREEPPDGCAEERPYLVMELVDGEPIDDYCDARRLSVNERIALLRQVARAVQHAHRKLVVHRDLKPSNVLVTPEGRAKLVDFGIAKLIEEQDAISGARASTQTGQRWVTPQYAAPEQIAREPVGTAVDVYQLGLLSYELLAGRRPFRSSGRLPHEVAQLVLEDTPAPPSAALTHTHGEDPGADETSETPGDPAEDAAGEERGAAQCKKTRRKPPSAQDLSERRSTDPRTLRRTLRGDLDRIILKALRKEPERRYASAEAFEEDLERYERDLPVKARPATLRYRASRFWRRHRLGIAVATLLALMGAGYAVSMVSQVRETSRQRDRAEALATFMVDLFEVSDPSEAASEAITARALLDRGARKAQNALHRQPATQASFLNVTGEVYQRLGLYEEAQPLLRQALAARQRLHGPRHPDVAATQHALGRLRYEQGHYDAAAGHYREALRTRRALLGADHPDVATSLHGLGWVRQQTGRYAAADSLFREALAMRRARLGEDHPDVAQSLTDRAAVLRIQGAYREAERLYREALRRYRTAFGQNHLRVAEGLHNVAVVLQNQGRYDDAEPYAQQALQRYRALFGEEHPDVATSLSNLAYVHQKEGHYDAAEANYREALAMRERMLGEEHPHVANSLNNLAALLQDQGLYQQADPLAERALDIYRTAYGNEHGTATQALTTLAWLRRNRGDLAGAESLFREVVEVRRALNGEGHPRVAKAQSYLANVLHARGTLGEAERRYRRALKTLDASVSASHPYRIIALTGLGDVLTDRQQPEEAEPLLREALALREDALPADHWRTAKTQIALGRCLAAQHRHGEARTLLLRAHVTLTRARGPGDPLTRRARAALDALPAALADAR